MIRRLSFVVFSSLLLLSCEKDSVEGLNSAVSFDITGRLLEGKKINAIATDNKGNIWVASDKNLYFTNASTHKNYNIDFPVLDLAIASDETLWIGTNGGGLAHFANGRVTWYTAANAGLPRDYIANVETGPDGKVWFSSCAFRIGGLGVFDGEKFEIFTPENSPLNQNIIGDIEIGNDGEVYIATTGTVSKTLIYRITNNSWDCLGDEEGMFYWVSSFSASPAGSIFLVEDFSLSSTFMNPAKLFKYSDDEWHIIDTDNVPEFRYFTKIKADKRNYCWVSSHRNGSLVLSVYDGASWISSPEDIFRDVYITTIETDNENNILVGTSENGVFILNQ